MTSIWRNAVQDMKPLEAVDYLLDKLESTIGPDGWRFLNLSGTERVLLRAMVRGGYVTPDSLAILLPGRDSDIYSVRTHVCRIRRKLSESPVRILTGYQSGYRAVAPEGFIWPWEAQ